MLKNIVKSSILRVRLRKVNYNRVYPDIHIGKYSLIETDSASWIYFNEKLNVNNYVKIKSEDNGTIIFGKRVYIGDYSTIRASRAQIQIGSNTMLAQYVKLISTNHYYKDKNTLIHQQDIDNIKKGIVIGDDCWLGADV